MKVNRRVRLGSPMNSWNGCLSKGKSDDLRMMIGDVGH